MSNNMGRRRSGRSLPAVLGGEPTWRPWGESAWTEWGGTGLSWDREVNADNPDAVLWPVWTAAVDRRLQQAARGRWAYNGPQCRELAAKMAELVDVRSYLPVANGSVALTIAVTAALTVDSHHGRLSKGEPIEVVTTAVSFNATPIAAALLGLDPVFVEVQASSLVPSVADIERAITPRTRIVLLPAMYAAITPLDVLSRMLKKHPKVRLIIDGAHAPFGGWGGRPFSDWADIATTSFQLGKVLTSGEGGAVCTNDPELAAVMHMVHNVGAKPEGDWVPGWIRDPGFEVQGYNQRLADWESAVLLAQLEIYPEQERQREEQYALLRRWLPQSGLPFGLLERSGDRILYKAGIINNTGIDTGAMMEALRHQLSGEVNGPYTPLCCAASGYRPESAPWQFGHLRPLDRSHHFAVAHRVTGKLMMFAADQLLRAHAAEHVMDSLTVLADNLGPLADWAQGR